MRCPFEIGDKIVCIEPNYHKIKDNTFKMSDNMPYLLRVTMDKTYEVIEIKSKLYDNIGIINDIDCSVIPSWDIFVSLKEYRKRKLKKINNI